MGITGNLKTMELSELLQWVSQSKKTGTLVIDNGKAQKRVVFDEGQIVASSSSDPREHLGHFLVSHGFITEIELAKAVEMQETTGMLLGKILVTIGALTGEDLKRLLLVKTEESLYEIFSWPEGEFRFLDDQMMDKRLISMELDVAAITLNGMRRVDEWKRIRQLVPSARAIPVTIGFLDDPELPPGERKILSLVNDDRTVQEICLETHSSEFHVSQVLYRQIEKGRLKIVHPRGGGLPPAAEPSTVSGTMTQVDAQGLLEAAERHMESGTYDRALRHLRAARSLEPDNSNIQEKVEKAESGIRQRLERAGVKLQMIPRLNRSVEELTSLQLSPEEGYVLSRINGSYDIQSILKISPMPQLDAQLVFLKLVKAGHIRLEKPR